MKDKKETAQEVPVQEQLDCKYPTKIQFESTVISFDEDNNKIYSSDRAIKVTVEIDSNLYLKKDLEREINLVCQKVLECFR